MNKINSTITAFDSVPEEEDSWPRSAELIAALEELERGSIDTAVDAVGRWLATRPLDDGTAREIAIFEIFRARKLRENGDLEGAAAALRGIGPKSAPLAPMLEEAIHLWRETGNHRFLAEYLLSGLLHQRFIELERPFRQFLDRHALGEIIGGLSPAEISAVLARLKPAMLAEICEGQAWSTLSLLYERANLRGLKPTTLKQLVGALNQAIADQRSHLAVVRLLALIGGVYNPVADGIAMPDMLADAVAAAALYFSGPRSDPPGEAPPTYMALGDAIAASSSAGDRLSATRAIWLIFLEPAGVAPTVFPEAIQDLLGQLGEILGPHQAEARLLRDLILDKHVPDMPAALESPRVQLASYALKAADKAIAAKDIKMARQHLVSAKRHAASPLPIALRSAALAVAARKLDGFLAELKAGALENQLGPILRAMVLRYGASPALNLASLLPDEALWQPSLWRTPPLAAIPGGETLLDMLLGKLAAQDNPPLEAALGALKYQIANQPPAILSRFLEPALRLVSRCAETEPVLACKSAAPVLGGMVLRLATSGGSVAGHDLLHHWSRIMSAAVPMPLSCGLAQAFIESELVDPATKSTLADSLLPGLLAIAEADAGAHLDERGLGLIVATAADKQRALELVAVRAASGKASAYAEFLEGEIDASLRKFDLKRADKLLALIEPAGSAPRKASTRRLIVDLLANGKERRQALSRIPADGLLQFLDQACQSLGGAAALRLLDVLPVSRLTRTAEWRRVAERPDAFAGSGQVFDRILDRLAQTSAVEPEAILIASRVAFAVSADDGRSGRLGKLLGLIDRVARAGRETDGGDIEKLANQVIAQFYLAECGHAPDLDECGSMLAKLPSDHALVGHYRGQVLARIESAAAIDGRLAEHAHRVLELQKRLLMPEAGLRNATESVFLLVASGDIAGLRDRLASLAAWQAGGKDGASIKAAAKFCLARSADTTVRGIALDILWRSKSEVATVLAAIWNIHPARFFEVVNWLAAKNLLTATVMHAAEQLPEAERRRFFGTLPISALRRKSQWSAAIVLTAKRNFEGAYSLVSFLVDKSRSGSLEAIATLELAAKALLPNLSTPQNYLLATAFAFALIGLPAGTRSPTLIKAIRPFSRVRDLEAVATQSFNSGDRRTAIAMIEAIAVSGRLTHDRLAKFVNMLIEFGEMERASRLVLAFEQSKAHSRHHLHHLRIALVEGDEAKIAAAANAIVKSKGASVPKRFDAPLSRLASAHLPKPLKRAVTVTFGVAKAKRRLENAAVMLRAKTVLGDLENARRLAARITGQGLLGSPIDEIGFLVHHSDFAAAEAKLAELVDNSLRRQRLLAKVHQPLRLRSVDRAVEHAYLLQRFLMNQGRDVSFLAKLEKLVLAALRSPWRSKLSSVAEGRLFTIGLAVLKIRLHSTEPQLPVMREMADELVRLTKSRTDRRIRLSQHLLQGWQSDGGHHVDQAIEAVTAEMRALLARVGAGKKKVDAEFAKRHFEEQRALGFTALDRKQATALARLVNTGLNLSNQQSAFEIFDDLIVTARTLLAHAASKKWFAVPILQAMARKVRDIAPDVPQALEFLQAADDGVTSDMRYLCLMAATMVSTGNSNDALRYVNRGLAVFPNSTTLLQLAVQIHGNLGNAQLARESAIRLAALVKAQAVFELGRPSRIRESLEIDNTLAQFKFRADTSKVMATVLPPRLVKPKGVVFASFYKCMASASITTMPFLELKNRGYDIVYLNSGTIDAEPTGHAVLDRFRGILQVDGSVIADLDTPTSSLIAEWKMDWDNRRIEADGINFYQPIFERLTQQSRTYSINVGDAQVGRQIKGMIRLLDRALYVAKLIKTEVCGLGIPVRFASSNWQYPPYAAFRIVCDAWKHECDIGFVAVSPGYESYYANLGKLYATTAAAVNMTVNHESRAPFLPIKSKFEDWYAANRRNSPTLDSEVKSWIATDRAGVGRELPPEALAVMERVRRFRAGGGKVIGVFGKIVYDLAVPYAGGPAHTDMKDFLNHTVACAARSETLVLIKPHPHEIRYEIARNPREYFTDMIEVDIPENVALLGHRWFNVRDMIEMIDLGVLWNGTTGVELGASGIPVVMCDDWGPRDYPVGHFAPKDRAHYEEIIRDPSLVKMAEDYPEKCGALLKYLSTDNVMRPYPFVKRGLVNVDVGPPVWDFAEVDRYLKEGDKYVSALADDFKFEGTRDA